MGEKGKNHKIFASRETIQSLPLFYQMMCEVLEKDGALVMTTDDDEEK